MARRQELDRSNIVVPNFDGENYDYWCVKMETFFKSLDVFNDVKNTFEEPSATKKYTDRPMNDLKK